MTAFVSARRAAELLGVSERTVRNRIARGELVAERSANGTYLLDVDAIAQTAPIQSSAVSAPRGSAPADAVALELVALVDRQSAEIRELAALVGQLRERLAVQDQQRTPWWRRAFAQRRGLRLALSPAQQ